MSAAELRAIGSDPPRAAGAGTLAPPCPDLGPGGAVPDGCAFPAGSLPGGPWQGVLGALRALVDFQGCAVLRRAGGRQEVLHLEGVAPEIQAGPPGERPGGLGCGTGPRNAPPGAPPGAAARQVVEIGIPAEGGAAYAIMLIRQDPDQPFRGADLAVFERFVPALATLARCAEQMRSADAAARGADGVRQALLEVLDRFGAALWLVDARLRVVLASARAARSAAFAVKGGRLSLTCSRDERRLEAAIAAAIEQGSQALLGLRLGPDMRPVRALVTALDAPAPGSAGGRLVAVILPSPTPAAPQEPVIQAMFGLTPVEAAIARLLCEGVPPNEAADRMRMRPNTLRGYLKAIFTKLDVHRQTDLVRLVSATAGLLHAPCRAPPPRAHRRRPGTEGA